MSNETECCSNVVQQNASFSEKRLTYNFLNWQDKASQLYCSYGDEKRGWTSLPQAPGFQKAASVSDFSRGLSAQMRATGRSTSDQKVRTGHVFRSRSRIDSSFYLETTSVVKIIKPLRSHPSLCQTTPFYWTNHFHLPLESFQRSSVS